MKGLHGNDIDAGPNDKSHVELLEAKLNNWEMWYTKKYNSKNYPVPSMGINSTNYPIPPMAISTPATIRKTQ